MVTGNKIQDALLLMETVVKQDKVPTILVVVKDLLTEALEDFNNIESKADQLDHQIYILKELYISGSSLDLLNKLILDFATVKHQYKVSPSDNLPKVILEELNKARDELLELEFSTSLTILQNLIYTLYTSSINLDLVMYPLEKIIIKMVYNVQLEQLILELNASVL